MCDQHQYKVYVHSETSSQQWKSVDNVTNTKFNQKMIYKINDPPKSAMKNVENTFDSDKILS